MTETPKDNDQDPQSPTAPKIIVDTDWKEQVEKEKATAAAEESESSVQDAEVETSVDASITNDPPTSGKAVAGGEHQRPVLPPPSFEILISMLFTQAISALGQIPNPVDGETSVDKPMAKHSIDMIEMLETKTKGNLTEDESKMLREALHALRMAFVGVRG